MRHCGNNPKGHCRNMSDAEFAGLGIVALIGVVFVIFLRMIWPSKNSPADAPVEKLMQEANEGIGLGGLAIIVVVLILALLFFF